MSSATSRRNPTVATNKSKANERQWGVTGFVFHTDIAENKDVAAALTRTYPYSGGKTNPKTRIQGNVTLFFRYMYHFRRFYGNKSARLIHSAVEDLKLEDNYVWEQIFNLYGSARQTCASNGYIASDAPLVDQIMCAAVDRVLSLDPVDHDLSDEDKKDLDDLRKKWKTTMFGWKKNRNGAEPYLPNGDNFLMQLLQPPAPAQDVEMEDVPEAVMDSDFANDANTKFYPRDERLEVWFADTARLVEMNTLESIRLALQRLELAVHDPRLDPELKEYCREFAITTEAQALAAHYFAMIPQLLAQARQGPH